jgi:hypothetical protein
LVALHVDEARAAGTERRSVGIFAKLRQHDTEAIHGIQHRSAVGNFYLGRIDGDVQDRALTGDSIGPSNAFPFYTRARGGEPRVCYYRAAMGLYAELRGFVLTHRECGVLRGATKAIDHGGFRLAVVCPCGARFGRSVSPRDPDAERLREALAAFQA